LASALLQLLLLALLLLALPLQAQPLQALLLQAQPLQVLPLQAFQKPLWPLAQHLALLLELALLAAVVRYHMQHTALSQAASVLQSCRLCCSTTLHQVQSQRGACNRCQGSAAVTIVAVTMVAIPAAVAAVAIVNNFVCYLQKWCTTITVHCPHYLNNVCHSSTHDAQEKARTQLLLLLQLCSCCGAVLHGA
jgi:hypothetical protein